MNTLDYAIRGGEHPNPERERIERQVAEKAFNEFVNEPKYHEKGIRWLFNLRLFETLYCTRTPEVLQYLFSKKPYPEFCEIEVTTTCDMKCKLCEHTYWNTPPRSMSLEEFKLIIDQLPNLRWIGMTGIGQSMLNKDYLNMIKYVKDKGAYVENFDNFKWITPEVSAAMINMGLDKLYASVDAAKEETFKKIQEGAEWESVLANIRFFDSYKRERNLHFPELWFHFIVTKENVDEMEDYLQMIHNLNIEVECVQFTKMLHPFKEVEGMQVEISDQKKLSLMRKASELGLRISFNINTADESVKAPISECTVWTQPFIFADGTVIPCCSQNEQNDRAFQIKTCMGNILTDGMRKVWTNFQCLVDKLNSGEIPEACTRCVLYKK
jgi:MoaA/NifB/PqqE/SkfB family radical SAM enzyme